MTGPIPNVASEEALAKEAYERVKQDWARLDATKLRRVNLDIPTAVQTILGALPELKALRPRFVQELPSFDIEQLDKLEDLTLALVRVESVYVFATRPYDERAELAEVAETARLLRRRLKADVKALAERGLFDPRKIDALKGRTGYTNLGLDLQSLGNELEASWPQIASESGVKREELDAAAQLAIRLLRVTGVRRFVPAVVKAAAAERKLAFTAVIDAWQSLREAVRYLRRKEGRAHLITPNLYTGKARRRKKPEGDAGKPKPVTPDAAPEPHGAALVPSAGSHAPE